jgi:hypothetical protein
MVKVMVWPFPFLQVVPDGFAMMMFVVVLYACRRAAIGLPWREVLHPIAATANTMSLEYLWRIASAAKILNIG